jgi:adenylosuccinate lyase
VPARIAGVRISGKINGAVGNYNAHLVAYRRRLVRIRADSWNGSGWNSIRTPLRSNRMTASASAVCAYAAANSSPSVLTATCGVHLGSATSSSLRNPVRLAPRDHAAQVNPIDFENSEGNLGVANALLQHLSAKLPVSRWQRGV